MNNLLNRFWILATGLFLLAAVLLLIPRQPALAAVRASEAVRPIGTNTVIPAQMSLSGDYLICAASIPNAQVAALCQDLPAGSIVLGVNPDSADPSQWRGAAAQVQFSFPEVSQPSLVAINIDWPRSPDYGLFSPETGKTAQVSWNGVTVWNKTSRDQLAAGRYYAARDNDAVTSVTVTNPGPFTLRIEVPAKTAWTISKVQANTYPQLDHSQTGNLRGIAYNPYRDCQTPDWGLEPSEAEIREDMARMAHTSNGLRTYSALGINGQIPRIAKDYNLRVCAGAWLTREKDKDGLPTPNKNSEELNALIALINDTNIQLDCVIVGNEVLLRDDLTEDQYISYIRQVKSAAQLRGIPVSIAEVYDLMLTHPKVAAELDWLQIHIYPYWHGQPISQSTNWVVEQYQAVKNKYPTKRVVIGETGWPSAGPVRGLSEPSMENQKRFLYEFVLAAEEKKIDYYYFDTFDEMWKREGGVGSHWGYLYSDRTGKHELQSLLVPRQDILTNRLYMPGVFKFAGSLVSSLAEWLVRFQDALPRPDHAHLDQPAQQSGSVFWVFQNYVSDDNHFAPSGWMGDISDLNLYECERTDLNSAETFIRIQYTPQGPQHMAGVYWQEPANNWGTIPDKGYNLDNANTLRFSARGAQGGEKVRFFMGGIWGTAAASDSQQPAKTSDVVTLTNQWQEYSIDLRGLNLSRVIGGFGFSVDNCLDAQPITFYLDNIRYDTTGDPGLPPPPATANTFDIYRDMDMPGNHFTPSGRMGDTGDLQVDGCYRTNPHAGSTAMRVAYAAQGQGPFNGCGGNQPCGWASVYWQDPANNWGTRPGGYDLSQAAGVSFWARGEKGGELVTFKAGGMNCASSLAYRETFCPAITLDPDPIVLTTAWQQYTIPFPSGTNLSKVMGPFAWAVSSRDNTGGATFYLDDIQYLFNQTLPMQGHSLYYGSRLATGYDMGVDTSGGLTNWVTDLTGSMRADYPAGQSWGAVFITFGPPQATYPRAGQDLSAYKTLSIDLYGQNGGEMVWIGLKDNTDPDNGTETRLPVTLTTGWKTYTFPLSDFTTADLTHLYIPAELVFIPPATEETIYFRNIRYLP